MPLDGLTGKESDGHDWYNLLNGWGLLEQEVLLVFTTAPDSDDAERLAFLSASVNKNGPTR